jgi:hypothetical protein
MATGMIRQTTFMTGEVDPVVYKRTDLQEYLTAAQSLKNFEVTTTGTAKKRKGTESMYDATGKATANTRMYDFTDKFGNHYIVLSDNLKFHILNTPESEVQVTAGKDGEFNVVTGRGTNVIAFEEGIVFNQDVDSPYTLDELPYLDYTEDNDALIFTHPAHPPARLYVSSYVGTVPIFAYQVLNIYPYPAYDFNDINYNKYTVTTLTVSGNTLTFTIDAGTGTTGFDNTWVDGQIIGGGADPTAPVGYAIITAVSNSGSATTFTATVQIPFKTSGFATQGAQYSIKKKAWSDPLGWPSKVLYYQNRLWFGNTESLPSTIFGSKINKPINFDVGTGADNDAIIYTIGENNSGAILWLNGGKQLEVFCENYEFAAPQNEDVGLTPSTFSIRQQSSYGVSPIFKPVTYLNDSYYIAKTGKSIINFHFNGVGLTYQASNVSAASTHLVKAPTGRAILRGADTAQDNFIYFLNPDDNTLTAFQFSAEYKLAALTPIEFQSDDTGSLIDLIAIVNINNQIYMLKYYNLTDKYIIERFNDDYRMDGARIAFMASNGVITGLDDLNKYTVQVVYQGQDFGTYVVNDGTITVDNPSALTGDVSVGLNYDVELSPMYFYAGAQAAPFYKKISRVYVDYYQSLNFYINGKLIPYQNFADIQDGLNLVPQTDTAIIEPALGWNRYATFSITQTAPFDLQITAIGYQIAASVL